MLDYKLEILISFLKLLLPFLIITSVSYFFSRILKVTDHIEKILVIFLFNWFQIIISIELLSLFNAVTPWNLLIFYSVSFLVCLFFYLKNRIKIRFSFRKVKSFLVNFYKNLALNRVLKIIVIIWFIIILFATLIVGMGAPPGNYDSMTYHLARAGFWKQYQSIDHYETSYIHQNDFPVNAEIGLLWIILFTASDSLTFLIQWISFVILLLCLYKILRILDYSPAISFLSTFIFATFDLVILESTSTQNDLVVASFVALALYFLVRVLKAEEISIGPVILTGFAAALAIGTKTYAVLFIPGFLVFAFLYGKIKKTKLLKILLVILFGILGCVLFASYNWIQNFQSYNNIFSDPEMVSFIRVEDPGLGTFISNFTRHITLFYQLNNLDFGIVSKPMQYIVNIVHDVVNLDRSAPSTTLDVEGFFFLDFRLNYDESSFGPICFFLVLPSVLFNLILFFPLNRLNRGDRLDIKFKNSFKALLIPVSFFILYVLIFKWTYLSSRYLIAFVALLMVSFAESLELLSKIKLKHFYKTVVFAVALLALVASIFPLFRNDYFRILDFSGSSIFKTDYIERVGGPGAPGRIGTMYRTKEMVDRTIGKDSDLGVILNNGDWVYIFFGRDFKRNLQYISDTEWNNSSGIEELLIYKDLDGLLVNTGEVDEFNTRTLEPLVSKYLDKSLLKIDKSIFSDYFKPLKGCEFIDEEDGVLVRAFGGDPHFESTFPLEFDNEDTVVMAITINSPADAIFQVFFKTTTSNYNEESSKRYEILEGENDIYVTVSGIEELLKIRIDPINIEEDVLIKKVEFFSLKESLTNVKTESEGEYILYYR